MAFLVAAAAALARDEAMASSYRAWANGIIRNPPLPSEPRYSATYDRGGVVGAAVQRGTGGLFVGASDPVAAATFADDFFAVRGDAAAALQGIVGMRAPCEAFAHRWRELTCRSHALRAALRNHKLTQVEAVPQPSGAARIATVDDIDWIGNAQHDFIIEIALPEDPARLRAIIPRRIEAGQFWLWEDGGTVAFAGWSDAPPGDGRIAPVYTPPHARGRGYATALVAALSQSLLDSGRRRLFLITDLANPTSNSIYAKIGYQPQSDLFHFDFVATGADVSAQP
ncbi:MAG: GNAT family N-acetyltransferase [Betaproteobacteria bacterium]